MANLLVYAKKSSSFTDELKVTYKNSLVFIEDENVIWTHGKSFGLSTTDREALEALVNKTSQLTITSGDSSVSSESLDSLEIIKGEGIIINLDETSGKATISLDFDSLELTDDEIDEACK